MTSARGGQAQPVADLDLILSELSRRLYPISAALKRTGGLPSVHALALASLKERPNTVGGLGVAIGIAQSRASKLVIRLEQLGLVTRERDRSNHRAFLIALSPAGRAALENLRLVVEEVSLVLLSGLSAPEREEMVRALATLSRLLPVVAQRRATSRRAASEAVNGDARTGSLTEESRG